MYSKKYTNKKRGIKRGFVFAYKTFRKMKKKSKKQLRFWY